MLVTLKEGISTIVQILNIFPVFWQLFSQSYQNRLIIFTLGPKFSIFFHFLGLHGLTFTGYKKKNGRGGCYRAWNFSAGKKVSHTSYFPTRKSKRKMGLTFPSVYRPFSGLPLQFAPDTRLLCSTPSLKWILVNSKCQISQVFSCNCQVIRAETIQLSHIASYPSWITRNVNKKIGFLLVVYSWRHSHRIGIFSITTLTSGHFWQERMLWTFST